MAEEEIKPPVEITLEQASKVIQEKGGKVFLSDHTLEEHIQNSEMYRKFAGSAGAAYKRSGELVANLLGVQVEEGEKFEDVLEKAKSKLEEYKKGADNPEIDALKTSSKEAKENLEKAMKELENYKALEFESNKIDLFKKALGDKALKFPDKTQSKVIEATYNQFQNDILSKAEFVTEDGKTYMKVDGNTYQGDSITSKLKEIIENSGYEFNEKSTKSDLPPGTLPDIPEDKLASMDNAKREEMLRKEISEKGLSNFSKEYFIARKRYGLALPQLAVKQWPELAK